MERNRRFEPDRKLNNNINNQQQFYSNGNHTKKRALSAEDYNRKPKQMGQDAKLREFISNILSFYHESNEEGQNGPAAKSKRTDRPLPLVSAEQHQRKELNYRQKLNIFLKLQGYPVKYADNYFDILSINETKAEWFYSDKKTQSTCNASVKVNNLVFLSYSSNAEENEDLESNALENACKLALEFFQIFRETAFESERFTDGQLALFPNSFGNNSSDSSNDKPLSKSEIEKNTRSGNNPPPVPSNAKTGTILLNEYSQRSKIPLEFKFIEIGKSVKAQLLIAGKLFEGLNFWSKRNDAKNDVAGVFVNILGQKILEDGWLWFTEHDFIE